MEPSKAALKVTMATISTSVSGLQCYEHSHSAGDYFLQVLMFDISADLHQNAKFNTRKNLNKPSQ